MIVLSDGKIFCPRSNPLYFTRHMFYVILNFFLQIIGNTTLENQKWEELLESLPPRQRRGLVPGRNAALLKELSTYVNFRQEFK